MLQALQNSILWATLREVAGFMPEERHYGARRRSLGSFPKLFMAMNEGRRWSLKCNPTDVCHCHYIWHLLRDFRHSTGLLKPAALDIRSGIDLS